MDNEAYECPECLQKIPGADMFIRQKQAEKKEKRKKTLKLTGGIILAVAFITGLTVLVTYLSRKDKAEYMKPVDHYIKGCVNNDYAEYISAFPPFYQSFFNQQFAYIVMGDLTEDKEKMYTADLLYHDEYYKSLAQSYGTNFEITYNIYSEKHLIESELDSFEQEFVSFASEDYSGIEFQDGYELTVVFTTKGNLGSNTVTAEEFRVMKIDGEWYMMNYVDFLQTKDEETNLENLR